MFRLNNHCTFFNRFREPNASSNRTRDTSDIPARQGQNSGRNNARSESTERANEKVSAQSVSTQVLSSTTATDRSPKAHKRLHLPEPAAMQRLRSTLPKGTTMPVSTAPSGTGVDAAPAQQIADRLNALNTQISNMGVSVAENTAGSDLAKSKGKQAST